MCKIICWWDCIACGDAIAADDCDWLWNFSPTTKINAHQLQRTSLLLSTFVLNQGHVFLDITKNSKWWFCHRHHGKVHMCRARMECLKAWQGWLREAGVSKGSVVWISPLCGSCCQAGCWYPLLLLLLLLLHLLQPVRFGRLCVCVGSAGPSWSCENRKDPHPSAEESLSVHLKEYRHYGDWAESKHMWGLRAETSCRIESTDKQISVELCAAQMFFLLCFHNAFLHLLSTIRGIHSK